MGVEGFERLVPKLIYILSTIHDYATDYLYYRTPSPWLQIKILKILRLFQPPEDEEILRAINDVLVNLVTGTEVGSNVNKNNADHAILFEAIRLVIHYKGKAVEVLRKDVLVLLGKFINVREANIRCLALEAMAKLSHNEVISSYLMKEHMNTIIYSLRDPDASIRRRALDLIFALCDQDSATDVVNELLVYLNENDYTLKEELVLKIAILAEKFALNLNWYVDVIVKLITTESAGDYVSDEIRFRVYQILTGFGETEQNLELQKYASLQIFIALQSVPVHETMVKLGASVLPEFGHHIADAPGKGYLEQFNTLYQHFKTSTPGTKSMIMTALLKMSLNDDSVREKAAVIFKKHSDSWDEDLQQRAVEYYRLLQLLENNEGAREFIDSVFEPLPTFPEHMQNNSVLIKRMSEVKKKKGLNVGKEDEKEVGIAEDSEQKSSVSAALSKGTTITKSEPASRQPKTADLLFGDSSDTPDTSDGGSNLIGIDDILGGGSSYSYSSEPAQKSQPSKPPADLFEQKRSEPTDGQIYEDNDIKVNIRYNVNDDVTKVLFEFISASSGELSDIQTRLKVPDDMDVTITEVRYPQNNEGNPKAMMTCKFTGNPTENPKIAVRFNTDFDGTKTVVFEVPVIFN